MAILSEFKLQHRSEVKDKPIGKFEAIFSNKVGSTIITRKDIPKFVQISDGTHSAYFKTTIAVGNATIFIANGKLEDIQKDSLVHVDKIGAFRFWRYKLAKDHNERMALFGFVLAVIGLMIDLALAITKGKNKPEWIVENTTLLIWASIILKFIGLTLVYVKGIREWK